MGCRSIQTVDPLVPIQAVEDGQIRGAVKDKETGKMVVLDKPCKIHKGQWILWYRPKAAPKE